MKKNEKTEVLTKLAHLCGECWFYPHCFIARGYEKNLAATLHAQTALPAA